jgi:hypothetical protein
MILSGREDRARARDAVEAGEREIGLTPAAAPIGAEESDSFSARCWSQLALWVSNRRRFGEAGNRESNQGKRLLHSHAKE